MTAATLSDAERAAVMVMLLDESKAATILGRLDPQELQVLGEKMCALGEIGPELIRDSIAGFVTQADRPGIAPAAGLLSLVRARRVLTRPARPSAGQHPVSPLLSASSSAAARARCPDHG